MPCDQGETQSPFLGIFCVTFKKFFTSDEISIQINHRIQLKSILQPPKSINQTMRNASQARNLFLFLQCLAQKFLAKKKQQNIVDLRSSFINMKIVIRWTFLTVNSLYNVVYYTVNRVLEDIDSTSNSFHANFLRACICQLIWFRVTDINGFLLEYPWKILKSCFLIFNAWLQTYSGWERKSYWRERLI